MNKSPRYPRPEEEYVKEGSFLDHHRETEESRLTVLSALQSAVTPVIGQYIRRVPIPVLEIGCGTGFFYRWLAPDWLKSRLVHLEINRENLR